MTSLRFGMYVYQNVPIPELVQRWRRAEALGFDVLWNVDTVVEPDHPRMMMFDGPTLLAAMALSTSRIRIGTLVTSLYFHNPVLAAKAAMTVDHLSNGRVEVALGVGDPSAAPAAAGVPAWPRAERVARFEEFALLTDRLLRQEQTTYHGAYYHCEDAEMIPGPVQRPRPPITIAAHGPKMLRIAAQLADAWSSWGGYGIETADEFFRVTSSRTARFDDLCVELGRDPARIRHSVVCFPPLTPWESRQAFDDMVGRFRAVGIDEFTLYWPQHWRDMPNEELVFQEVCADAIPAHRTPAAGVDPVC